MNCMMLAFVFDIAALIIILVVIMVVVALFKLVCLVIDNKVRTVFDNIAGTPIYFGSDYAKMLLHDRKFLVESVKYLDESTLLFNIKTEEFLLEQYKKVYLCFNNYEMVRPIIKKMNEVSDKPTHIYGQYWVDDNIVSLQFQNESGLVDEILIPIVET